MNKIEIIYKTLYKAFGPQHWWPGDAPFEVAVGAILTQNTNWGNVEKAINNLKAVKALTARKLHEMPINELAQLIRPAGYFNVKARRLKTFMDFIMSRYNGSIEKMRKEDMQTLRERLLSVNGIGPETADSILLYALDKPVFLIDAYTKRVLSRHDIMEHNRSYDDFQGLFHSSLKRDIRLFNEFHALFVRTGKTFCRPMPECERCPLSIFLLPEAPALRARAD